jgi:TIR domain
MAHPVFISYARKTSRELAEGLHRELGGESGLAFLDTSDIEAGEQFPKVLVDALLDAKVIVVFADETYFNRWYCLRELRTALAPFEALLRRGMASEQQSAAALLHLVVALPQQGSVNLLDGLPPLIQKASWPSADQTATLAQLVKTKLSSIGASIRAHIGSDLEADAIRATLLGESALPPPMNLAGVIQFPLALRVSLGEGFVGRANDLWRIHFILSTMRGEPATSAALSGALEGGGGFGKTQLALEYLHRFGGHYLGGLFWVDADVSEEALMNFDKQVR